MLSGRWENGSSNAPLSGKIGTDLGRSEGWLGRFGTDGSCSGEQRCRKQPPSLGGGGVLGAPGFEELDQLLARAVLVPGAVALEDGHQSFGGLDPLAFGIERQSQVEAGLMVVGVGS